MILGVETTDGKGEREGLGAGRPPRQTLGGGRKRVERV